MASQLFGLPIAAISLTDSDRQWFKSRVGVDNVTLPRHLAPCSEVAESCGNLIIPDLLEDETYQGSILASRGIRFYAGAPLVTRDGYGLGAMCVLGTEPREVTEKEIAALEDLAAMVMAQIELQHAFGRVDALTGLANRNQLVDDIEDAARDYPGEDRVAVLVDLVPVQQLSEALRVMGPAFIDDLARTAVRLLRAALPDTKIYHVDSTHYGYILPQHDPDLMFQSAQRVQTSLGVPLQTNGVPMSLNVALGMAPFTLGKVAPRDVVRTALSAAQDARDLEKPIAVYSALHDQAHKRRFSLLTHMRAALDAADQLSLVFQPRVDLHSGKCTGAEALLRWTHPEIGAVSPSEFVPVIEQTGLAQDLTEWVVKAALKQISIWRKADLNLVISVNISAVNLDEEDFSERLLQHLRAYDVPAGMLEVELTESALIRNGQRAIDQLNRLSRAGIRLAVDDFGTGYSSLAYLQNIPADAVKIDRSFITDLGSVDKTQRLVGAMISMLHGLNFRVVAEGVESLDAYHLLALGACDEVQGYLVSRPLSAPAFEEWIEGFAGVEADNVEILRQIA